MCIHHLMSNAAWAKSEESSAIGLTHSRDATLRSNSLMVDFNFDFIFMISLTSLLGISSGNVFALGLNFGFSTDASGKTLYPSITSQQKTQPEEELRFFCVFTLAVGRLSKYSSYFFHKNSPFKKQKCSSVNRSCIKNNFFYIKLLASILLYRGLCVSGIFT